MKRFISALMLVCMLMGLSVPANAADGSELTDIRGDEWYANEVIEMVESGLIAGFPDKTFKATQSISSAEFVTIVARAVGAPSGRDETHWAGATMSSALAAGWFTDAEIFPSVYDQAISRQQAAMVLVSAFRDQLVEDTSVIPSIADQHIILNRFAPYVLTAYRAGLFKGDSNGNFNPYGNLSRAEAAVIIFRATEEPAPPVDKPLFEIYRDTGWFVEVEPDVLVPKDSSIQGILVILCPGETVSIKMNELDGGYFENSRLFVKQLLELAFPANHDVAYSLMIDTILDRVFEKHHSGMNPAGSVRYLDTRSYTTSLISRGAQKVSICIGKYGDYADYELESKKSPSFTGYFQRGFGEEHSKELTDALIEKYNIYEAYE